MFSSHWFEPRMLTLHISIPHQVEMSVENSNSKIYLCLLVQDTSRDVLAIIITF